MRFNLKFLALFCLILFPSNDLPAAETRPAWQIEWEKTIDEQFDRLVARHLGLPRAADQPRSARGHAEGQVLGGVFAEQRFFRLLAAPDEHAPLLHDTAACVYWLHQPA